MKGWGICLYEPLGPFGKPGRQFDCAGDRLLAAGRWDAAAFPRLKDGTDYLKAVPLEGISDEDRNLLWLFSSLVTVSFPVEVWGQARVPDAGASSIDVEVEPVP